MKRILLAFLIAPIPAALVQSVVVAIWPKPGQGVFDHPASMFVAICLLFYLFELVLAFPLYLALRKRGQHRMASYGFTGALLTLLPVAVALGVAVGRSGLSTYTIAYNLAFFGMGGFLAGALFWRVAVRSNPAPA